MLTLRIVPAFRTLLVVGTLLFIVITTFLWYSGPISLKSDLWRQHCLPVGHGEQNITTLNVHSTPIKRKNVVVASRFGHHFDVYMAMVWTLERVTNKSIPVYAEQPFYHGFNEVVQNLGIHTGPFHDYEQLQQDLAKDDTIDMVVFGTCEVDMREIDQNEEFLAIWDARDAAHKFEVVCIVHHVGDTFWQRNLPDWTSRNTIRFVTLSKHVSESYRFYFDELADEQSSDVRGYEYLPIDVHSPILDIPHLLEPSPNHILSNAVIQGSFSTDRRDYEHLFAELIKSLAHDPRIWGYLPLGEGEFYEVDTSLPDTPFKLHLLGSGDITIPDVLRNIALVRRNLNYTEYYAYMNAMDICVPAFARNEYYSGQASSTMFMAMESNLPILATHRMRAAYNHINDDRVAVTRPAAMSELAALRALRTGDASVFLQSIVSGSEAGIPRPLQEAIDDMMRKGWRRTSAGFREVKRKIWTENDRVVERLLRDL